MLWNSPNSWSWQISSFLVCCLKTSFCLISPVFNCLQLKPSNIEIGPMKVHSSIRRSSYKKEYEANEAFPLAGSALLPLSSCKRFPSLLFALSHSYQNSSKTLEPPQGGIWFCLISHGWLHILIFWRNVWHCPHVWRWLGSDSHLWVQVPRKGSRYKLERIVWTFILSSS